MQLINFGNNETEIQLNNGSKLFFSYSTLVLVKTQSYDIYQTTQRHSQTTQRHINRTLGRWGAVDGMVSQEELESMVKLGDI